MRSPPDYAEAFRQVNGRRVVEALARLGGVARFSDIEKASGVKGSTLVHHLNRLERVGVVAREAKGVYSLVYKTPLCFVFPGEKPIPVAYLGLLGEKVPNRPPEPKVAIDLLSREGLSPSAVYVLTSYEALGTWRDDGLGYTWILCYDDEIIDVEAVREKALKTFLELLKTHILIVDCTSATRAAGFALYDLAREYLAPLIYVYEAKKKLVWILSREKIMEKLGLKT